MSELQLKDIVFVPSVQHTGTWFVINFLRRFIPREKELTFLLEDTATKPHDAGCLYRPSYSQLLDAPVVVHVHLPIFLDLGCGKETYDTWFHRTWAENMTTKRSVSVETLLLLCNFFKTVIPVRDPMAAILTHEVRYPQFRHFCIVDGFVALATEFARHPNVKFFPVDMLEAAEQREELLNAVLTHCCIDSAEHVDLVREFAASWTPENTTPENRFRTIYQEQDLRSLQHLLGPKWAEIEYLRNMASVIMPWMAELGYAREQLVF